MWLVALVVGVAGALGSVVLWALNLRRRRSLVKEVLDRHGHNYMLSEYGRKMLGTAAVNEARRKHGRVDPRHVPLNEAVVKSYAGVVTAADETAKLVGAIQVSNVLTESPAAVKAITLWTAATAGVFAGPRVWWVWAFAGVVYLVGSWYTYTAAQGLVSRLADDSSSTPSKGGVSINMLWAFGGMVAVFECHHCHAVYDRKLLSALADVHGGFGFKCLNCGSELDEIKPSLFRMW
jgi:hypothetical protein